MESLSNKVVSLKAWNSIKNRLQQRCFPVKFKKFLRTPFFTEQLQWLLLRSNSCFQRSPEQKPMQPCPIIPNSAEKKCLLSRKSRSSHSRCSAKEGLQLNLLKRGSSIAKCLRIPLLKNICEQLFLKISTSVTNLLEIGDS